MTKLAQTRRILEKAFKGVATKSVSAGHARVVERGQDKT